jgi:hypothetical protein
MWISKLAFLTLAFAHLGLAAPADELNKNFARDDNGLQKVVRYRLPIPNPQSPISKPPQNSPSSSLRSIVNTYINEDSLLMISI